VWIKKYQSKENSNNTIPQLNNPEYNRISRKISKLKLEDRDNKLRGNKELRKLCNERLKIPRTIPNPEYSRVEYVRYADD
jgi:hypothetical protein